MITPDKLVQIGIPTLQAAQFAEPLRLACKRFDIATGARIAAFVTQTAWRSKLYTVLEDDLHYRTAEAVRDAFPRIFPSLALAGRVVGNPERLANLVYCGRLGNGDILGGDGWRYRPRGCLPIVGRAEYMAVGEAVGMPYKDKPDLVAEPAGAIVTAAWYWATAGLNQLIDQGNFDATTVRIGLPVAQIRSDHSRLFRRALDTFFSR